MKQNIVRNKDGQWEWAFDLEAIDGNVNAIGSEKINFLSWGADKAIYTGRNNFYYPESSDFFHIGSNETAIFKHCSANRGLNRDIFTIQDGENAQSKI